MARAPSRHPRGGKPVRLVTPGARVEKQAIDDAMHYGGLGAHAAQPTPPAPIPEQADEPTQRARSRRR